MENEAKDEGQVKDNIPQNNGSEDVSDATGKTINISGKSFNVSDDIAQAYGDFTTSVDRKFEERSQELGALREYKRSSDQRVQEQVDSHNQEKPVDYGTLMYEDPDKFVGSIDDKIEASEKRMTQRYQDAEVSKQNEKDFWESMWIENKDLAVVKKQARDVLNIIGQKYSQRHLPNTKEVRDAYAQEARDWIKGIAGGNISNSQDGFVEGPSTTTTPTKSKKEDKPRKTTKQLLEEKKEKRREAMVNRT